MTTLLDLDAFLRQVLRQRREPARRAGLLRGPRAALDLVARCEARLVFEPFFAPAYAHQEDLIIIPPQSRRLLRNPQLLAREILHELVHWSGAAHRINRPRHREPFDAVYNREELTADIGAVLLSFDLGITRRPLLTNYTYLSHYLATLDRPDIALNVALSLAQQAAAYLHAIAHSNGQLQRLHAA